MKKYRSLIIALVSVVLVFSASAYSDKHIYAEEMIQLVIQLATAAGVWLTANVPGARAAKATLAGILAAANLAITFLTGGIDVTEVINLVIAFGTAAGILVFPNQPAVTTGGSSNPPVR